MSRKLILAFAAVAVIALAILNLVLGVNLLPPIAEAQEKGTFAPLLITWALVLISAGCAVALAGFIVSVARER